MAKSLLLVSLITAGVYAQPTPDPSLIKGGEFQHLGCVAIKPGTFPRQFDVGQTGCTSSCSTNGNIIAFHGNSCACDRLDLSPKPIPYRLTKVDNSLCNQWCDPADKSKGTCGGSTIRGWPVYDLYKRNDAKVVFVPFPGDIATPVAPGQQTPAPIPNDPGHKPGDIFHDCPPDVVDCPYRKKCPGGNCGGAKPIPQPCHGCSPPNGGKNWTAPACPPAGCPGQAPTPGGGGQNGQNNQGGNGNNGGQGGDNNGGAGGSGGGQDSGNGSQGSQGDGGSSGAGGNSGNGGSDSQSDSDATGGQGGSGQDGTGQGEDGAGSGSSAGGSGGSGQGSQGQGQADQGDDQSGCTGTACPIAVSLGIKAEAGGLMFAVVVGALVGLW